jgi:hypothetical protein
MGKKSNKKQFKKFIKNNRVLLAALAGTATGITIAGILGTERAQQLVEKIDDSVRNFGSTVKDGNKNSYKNEKKEPAQSKDSGL